MREPKRGENEGPMKATTALFFKKERFWKKSEYIETWDQRR